MVTELIDIATGIRQGDSCSTLFFNLILEEIVKKVISKNVIKLESMLCR